MKRFLPVLVLLLAGCFVRAQDEFYDEASSGAVSPDGFGPSLDPYGNWLVLEGYGRAWQPSPQFVGNDFYPYGTGGKWLYTNAGWVFDSDYPFGWAVFHYGRWYRDAAYGWLWIPGRTWGPSWVSWRAGGPYIGWAPLGPRGAPGYDSWCFVPSQRFTSGYPRRYSLRAGDYHRAVAVTAPVRTRNSVSVGPPASYVSSATREQIVPVPLRQVPSAGRAPPPSGRGRNRYSAPVPPPAGRFEQERGRSVPPPPGELGPGAPPPSGFDRRAPDRSVAPPPPSGFDGRAPDRSTAPPPPSGFERRPPDRSIAPPPPASDRFESGGQRGVPPPPAAQPAPSRSRRTTTPAPPAAPSPRSAPPAPPPPPPR